MMLAASSLLRALLWLFAFTPGALLAQTREPPPALAARAWVLIDHESGQLLAAQNPDMKVEPASLTKIMTSYLGYAALREGRLRRNQVVPVSEKAWKAIGSRMFIEPNKPVTVDELLHGIVVQSGNDASIALAEAIAGSEEAFVALMNAEAKRLGMNGTHFANATGLPDPQHYTTARDLARLTTALIRDFPEDYKTYALKDYTYNKIKQPNRNRLLWLDERIDGVKTGHTETAGFCLIASRFDGTRRLTAVVLGTASEQARAQETLALLHYGFRAFEAVKLYDKEQSLTRLKVFKGAQGTLAAGFTVPLVLSLPKGVAAQPERLKVEVLSRQPLIAPVRRGEAVARLRLSVDGEPWGEYPLVALADVPLAGFFGRAWDGFKLFFQ
ncbi:MAG: D-alanyl-D-alanine carboxypeptidase [Rhodocyclaceae bacterium]|nr:D-alanyl-D-alanine carboxypeptidase [Rhodocyclaceae bacterium]